MMMMREGSYKVRQALSDAHDHHGRKAEGEGEGRYADHGKVSSASDVKAVGEESSTPKGPRPL